MSAPECWHHIHGSTWCPVHGHVPTLADQGVGTDARCPAHPNEDLPCRECSTDPRDFYREGGEYFRDAGDSVWSTCLCSYDDHDRRELDVACPVHARDAFDVRAFVARVGVDAASINGALTIDYVVGKFEGVKPLLPVVVPVENLYDDTALAAMHFVDTFDNPVLGPEWVPADPDVLFTEGYALIDPEIVDAIHGHLHDR